MEATWIMRRGFSIPNVSIGLLVTETAKTVSVRELWRGKLSERITRWPKDNILGRFHTMEAASEVEHAGAEAFKALAAEVLQARAELSAVTERQREAWRAAIAKAEGLTPSSDLRTKGYAA